jgi:hypothetical protein
MAIGLAASSEAHADDESGVLDSRHHAYESPQHFAFEFRLARYIPNIDGDPALKGAHPYGNVFGTMPRVAIGLELDWQTLRIPYVGTIGPGVSVGYTNMSAPAAYTPPGSGPSPEDTSLDIFPMYGVLVLRADVFARRMHIPIVPYAKAGIGLAFWRAYNDAGTSTVPPNNPGAGAVGKGHTFGTHFALGAALVLDVFDSKAARNLDSEMGINHTYLFGEYFLSDLTGLGQSNVLFVGTRNFAGGLAFEF